MSLVDLIGEKNRHQELVNKADKDIKQRAFDMGVRNKNIDSVFDLTKYNWRYQNNVVHLDWNSNGEFQELDMCITEHFNEGPVFVFSVWDCNLSGNIGEDAIVLLNGRNLIGELNVKSNTDSRVSACSA